MARANKINTAPSFVAGATSAVVPITSPPHPSTYRQVRRPFLPASRRRRMAARFYLNCGPAIWRASTQDMLDTAHKHPTLLIEFLENTVQD